MAVDNSVPNFFNNCPVSINIETNIEIDFNLDNSNSNKDSYFSNNHSFLFNHDYHKNNLNGGSNNKSNTSLTISIQKRIWQQ